MHKHTISISSVTVHQTRLKGTSVELIYV